MFILSSAIRSSLVIISEAVILLAFFIMTPSFSKELPDTVGSRGRQSSTHALIDISVSFDMENRLVRGKSSITFPEDRESLIRFGAIRIKSIRLDGKPIMPEVKDGAFKIKTKKGSIIEMEYEYVTGKNDSSIIDKKGISLIGNWYPSIDGLAYYRLSALVPHDFMSVSEADEIKIERTIQGNLFLFDFFHPVDGINFIAGRFGIKKEGFRGIELYAYFFPEDTGLNDTYLEYTKKYLELYEGILGKYPYKRFSVVENFLPTGYSMPSFTLLGQDVIRLPFIVKTSLGHEILHQWFGNLVYVDYEKGNWSEGLATYLSDHLYEEREGRGWQYRKQILIDYDSYITPEKEFRLRDFRGRTDLASRSIGYGKSAMVFHMLRGITGDEAFFKSLINLIDNKKFHLASWNDIKTAFEMTAGKKLDWFFEQWVNGKGYPTLKVSNIKIRPEGFKSIVSFDIVQEGGKYTIDIPVSIKSDNKETQQTIRIRDTKQSFEIPVEGNPEKIVLDEGYNTFRKLSVEETPPVIGKILGDEKGLLVLPEGGDSESLYSEIVNFFKEKDYALKEWKEVKDEDIRSSSVIALGFKNPIVKRLFGRMAHSSSGFVLMAKKNPFNPSKVIAIVEADSKDEVKASFRKISHYGKYSMVAFKNGKNIQRDTDESQRGINVLSGETVIGFETSSALKLDDIIDRVSHKRIVYIGEQHDKYEHHLMQLEVIKGLFKKNQNIAIGMEMFQRSFQKSLDDYVERRIDEKEFLKSSEYFKRWGFDYNLYKDILRFARDEKIPVIALNIGNEITGKASKNGIDSLSEDDKKELPESMDMTDEAYKQRLKEIFKKHEHAEGKNFDNFYQSQILWDETMAQTIDEFLKKNPNRQMIVIAGGGHLFFSSGIPKRAFRRNGLDYAIILNDASVETGIADFVVFPKYQTLISSPKLMVFLKEEEGRVRITGFAENSVSEKAGLKKGDIIVKMDEDRVNSMEDVHIFLFYKKKGDTVKVRVLRRRFLLGESELQFDVTL